MTPLSSWQLLAPLILALTLQVAVAIGLYLWARWVARRREARWWRGVSSLPLVALTLTVISVVITSVFLKGAFDAISGGDPATKAARLAENIASALRVSLFFAIPAKVLYLLSLVISIVGSTLKPTRRYADRQAVDRDEPKGE